MIKINFIFTPAKAALVLGGAMMLTGCVGRVDGPSGEVVVAPSAFVVQDDYVYYPRYGVYYSDSRHQYAYLDRGAWVAENAPRGVSIDALRASPSVKMDFHDAPANHHATVARQYPKNWKPDSSKKPGDTREERGGK